MTAITSVLVADDLAREDRTKPSAALWLAADLAAAMGAEIHLLHAYRIPPLLPPSQTLSLIEPPFADAMAAALEAQAAAIQAARHGARIRTSVENGPTVDAILGAAGKSHCQCIAVATHARGGARRAILGSVSEELIRRSPVPVLSVNPHAELSRPFRPGVILVPLEIEGGATAASSFPPIAAQLARAWGARIRLLHVVEEWVYPVVQSASLLAGGFVLPLERELAELANLRSSQLDALAVRLRDEGVPAEASLVERAVRIPDAIIEAAASKDCGLIVMSHHRASRLGLAIQGSVSRQVAREAHCPVITVQL